MSQSASTTYSHSSTLIDYKKWNQLLFTPQLPIKIQQFRKWHKSSSTVTNAIQTFIDKNQKYMKNEKFLHLLNAIVVFYCTQNSINYQQGLLQIAIPFVLLKSSQCKARQCYGYFDSFMNRYFPALLTQKLVYHKKQLPMASISLHLTATLLNYLYPQLFYHLKSNQVPLSMVFTQQLLTVFAKNLDIELVYELFEKFMEKCKEITQGSDIKMNHNNSSLIVLILMCISLIGLKEEQIIQKQEEQIHMFLAKSLKKIKSTPELIEWFQLYDTLRQKVPRQFYSHCQKTLNLTSLNNHKLNNGLNSQGIRTQQVYEMMIQKDKEMFSYLIQVNVQDLKESQYVFVTLNSTKTNSGILKNSHPLFSLQKCNNVDMDISKAIQKFDGLMTQIQKNKSTEILIVIVIQAQLIVESGINIVHFAQKFIEQIQTNKILKCMKMYIQFHLVNSKHSLSSLDKKRHCALI